MTTPDAPHPLTTFTRTGSPDAFAALVSQHLDLVYAAARRQSHNPHDAEDITQAVFILLAQKARAIPNPSLLPAWLLKVTHFAANNARKRANRRRHHEQEAAAMLPTTTSAPDLEWDQVSPHLDAALAQLSPNDRAAIIAHCIQDQPIPQLATSLKLTEPAARKRIQRALQRLRALLPPQTAALSLAIPALLAARGLVPAPPPFASTISTTALAAAHGTLAACNALTIAKGTSAMLTFIKLKIVAALVAALLILTSATFLVHHVLTQTVPPSPTTPTASDSAATPAPLPAPASAPASQPADWRPEFSQLYHLDPGQSIKFIPEPYIPQREAYWQARLTEIATARGTAPPTTWRAPSNMVFILRDTDQVQTKCGLYIPNFTPGLAGVLKSLSLANVPSGMFKPEIGPEFASVNLRGDWIVRDDTRGGWLVRSTPVPDAVWRDLEQILKDRTGRTIRFEKRTVDRDYVVVQGRLALAPLDDQHDAGTVYIPVGAAGNSTVVQFLHALTVWTDCAFVDETQSSTQRLRWEVLPAAFQTPVETTARRAFQPAVAHTAPSTAQAPDTQPAAKSLDRMLADLARQTSLQFKKEKRPVEVITAVEGP